VVATLSVRPCRDEIPAGHADILLRGRNLARRTALCPVTLLLGAATIAR